MEPNTITEEIRAIRHQLAAEFDNDVHRIGAELRRRQEASGHHIVRLPRRPLTLKTTILTSEGTGTIPACEQPFPVAG